MRILLMGEYSNLHHSLCQALRRAGHDVLLISDGDGWKDYPRDVDLRRRQQGPWGSLRYLMQLATLLPRLRGYDVVQLINPVFLDVKARWNRWVFDYLKRHNRLVSVGCFGDDYYVISRMQDDTYLRYTDFWANHRTIDHEVNRHRIATWMSPDKVSLTRYVMHRADCLIACLYEYWKVYDTDEFRRRLHYVALPVELSDDDRAAAATPDDRVAADTHDAVRILFATQRRRGQMKGTDQLEPLFDRLASEYPQQVVLTKVESVPFAQYQQLVSEADVVVDQLYSFTPAMAALESMRQGKVVISGFEQEYADFIGYEEGTLPPIINLRPFDDEWNYRQLVTWLTDPQKIAQLRVQSQAYVRRYHDADAVASRYIEVWESVLSSVDSSSR